MWTRRVCYLHTRIHTKHRDTDCLGLPLTVRTVFVIDPKKKIRLTLTYPASTGRNTAEVLRVVQALQTTDAKGLTTPINWLPGDDVVIPPTVSTEDAQKKYGAENIRIVKP
jgi:glutaredoxin/glutathione-dependent peroxiredoxin